MKIAKFMFKFINQMLPDFIKNYFTKLDNIYNRNTRQKNLELNFFNILLLLIKEKNSSSHRFKNEKNVPKELCHCTFSTFKKSFKTNSLFDYESCEIVKYNYMFDIGVL